MSQTVLKYTEIPNSVFRSIQKSLYKIIHSSSIDLICFLHSFNISYTHAFDSCLFLISNFSRNIWYKFDEMRRNWDRSPINLQDYEKEARFPKCLMPYEESWFVFVLMWTGSWSGSCILMFLTQLWMKSVLRWIWNVVYGLTLFIVSCDQCCWISVYCSFWELDWSVHFLSIFVFFSQYKYSKAYFNQDQFTWNAKIFYFICL